MVGKKSAVVEFLKEKLNQNPIIIWYSLNHRLDLAVHDTIVEMNTINDFKAFMENIY